MDSQKLGQLLYTLTKGTNCKVAGVFPRDQIPQSFESYPTCLIANTDTSDLPGQHWVCYFFKNPSDYEFFDSYGLHPINYGFSLSSPSFYNTRSLQSLTSAVCGQFCLFFIHAKSCGHSLPDIVHSFTHTNPIWNDKVVRNFINQITKPYLFSYTPFTIIVLQNSCIQSRVRNHLIKIK